MTEPHEELNKGLTDPSTEPSGDHVAAGDSGDEEASPGVVVSAVPGRKRYEARVEGYEEAGVLDYREEDGAIVLAHTYVPDPLEGRGVGAALARHALDAARERGVAVYPECSFVAAYIRRHREYASLVPSEARASYRL